MYILYTSIFDHFQNGPVRVSVRTNGDCRLLHRQSFTWSCAGKHHTDQIARLPKPSKDPKIT